MTVTLDGIYWTLIVLSFVIGAMHYQLRKIITTLDQRKDIDGR